MPLAKKEKKVKGVTKFKIDLTNPIDDGIIDIKKFEAFLKDKIKVSTQLRFLYFDMQGSGE